MRHRSIPTFVAAGVLALGLSAAANAAGPLTVVSAVGGGPSTAPGTSYVNFNGLPLGLGGGTATAIATGAPGSILVTLSPDAQVVNGPAPGLYAPPVLSGGNGLKFDVPSPPGQPDGTDTTNYITSGSFGSVVGASATLGFSGQEEYLGILWGSVDLYNTLSFYEGATLIGAITGVDVNAAANGDQGAAGTFYVNINSTTPFDRVVATSAQYAFEFDNVAFAAAPIAVPEPMTVIPASLAALFGGLALVRRRRAVS